MSMPPRCRLPANWFAAPLFPLSPFTLLAGIIWLSAGMLPADEFPADELRADELRADDAPTHSPEIRETDLERHVRFLASDTLEGREAGSRGGRAACQYLIEELQRLGLAAAGDNERYVQDFGDNYRNVLAVLPGSDPERAREIVLIGAHYDHVGYGRRGNALGPVGSIHNGADDNASGTAAVLEIAEAFATGEVRPRRTILFAFWDAEELNLNGSEYWCTRPTSPRDRLRLAINVDMVGRLRDDRVYTHGVRTAAGLRGMMTRANSDTDLSFDFSPGHVRDSDHYSFFRVRIPYLMFDTGKHGDYHRPSDDAERVNLEGLARITRMLLALAREATSCAELAPFRRESIAEAQTSQHGRSPGAAPPRLGVSWHRRREGEPLVFASVDADSPAARAGLEPGDVLLRFGGWEPAEGLDFASVVAVADAPVAVVIDRPGAGRLELSVELAGSPVLAGCRTRRDPAEPDVEIVSERLKDSALPDGDLQIDDRILSRAAAVDPVSGAPCWKLHIERNGRSSWCTLPKSVLRPAALPAE